MHKDMLGREIKVGDVIVYGGRRGSHGTLHVGVVTGFTEKCVLLTSHEKTWTGWTTYRTRSTEKSRRIITGLTEEQLREWTGVSPKLPRYPRGSAVTMSEFDAATPGTVTAMNAHMKSASSLAVTPEDLEYFS